MVWAGLSCAPELLRRHPTQPVLTATGDKNAALDFTPNKVNGKPPYHPTPHPPAWKKKGFCFTSPRWALWGTSLTEVYGEIQLTNMWFRRVFISERNNKICWRSFLQHVQSIHICCLLCKTGVTVSLPSRLPMPLCTRYVPSDVNASIRLWGKLKGSSIFMDHRLFKQKRLTSSW